MILEKSKAEELLKIAFEQTKSAYAPYSHFHVGAALLGESGHVYDGCNVENGSYGAGICAERNAICHAISCGERTFRAIAVVGGNVKEDGTIDIRDYCFPCGICRQVMQEFCGKDFEVILTDSTDWNRGRLKILKLEELLPYAFSLLS